MGVGQPRKYQGARTPHPDPPPQGGGKTLLGGRRFYLIPERQGGVEHVVAQGEGGRQREDQAVDEGPRKRAHLRVLAERLGASTITLPGFILRSIARVMSFGAFAPGNNTAPISKSQSAINPSRFDSLE